MVFSLGFNVFCTFLIFYHSIFIFVLNLNKRVFILGCFLKTINGVADVTAITVVYKLSMTYTLESEEQQEGHHKTEKTHSFRQGETQDSI